jgi:hypothetical protein
VKSDPIKQPEELKTDEFCRAAHGRGNDVWSMLKAATEGDLEEMTQLAAREPSLIVCGGYYRTSLSLPFQPPLSHQVIPFPN